MTKSSKSRQRERITPWLGFAVVSAVFGSSFLFGYNIGVLNAPQSIIGLWIRRVKCQANGGVSSEELSLTDNVWCKKLDADSETTMFAENGELNTLWALMNCLLSGGAIFGALGSSFFVNRFGPKNTLLGNNIPAIVAVLLTSLASTAGSVEMMIVGRFVAGVNCGINAGVTPTYLTEIAPASMRGAVGSMHQLFVVGAIWISQILGLPFILGNPSHWPYLLALAAVPIVYQLATLPFCPESPKYLFFVKRDEEEAVAAMTRLRGSHANIDQEMELIRQEYAVIKNEPKVTWKELFVDPFLQRILLITFGLMVFQQLSGVDAVVFYSTAIFQGAGLTGNTALYATIGLGAINVTMTIIALVLVEKAGRRMLLLIGYCGMAVFLILLTVSQLLYKSSKSDPEIDESRNSFAWTAYASSVCLVGFIVMFATGPGAIPWILMSEIFAQGARAPAAALAVGVNRLFSLGVALSFPYMQASINEYSFLVFLVFIVCSIIFTYRYVIETRGKSIDEIQLALRSKMPRHHIAAQELASML